MSGATCRAIARAAAQVRLGAPGAVPSPCLSVCRMSESTGLCEGCFRTLDEIAAWSGLDDAGKRQVWVRIEERASLARSMTP